MKGKKTGGRTKGTPNKITKEIREAYELLISHNLPNMGKWLQDIAKDSPARAFDIILRLSEFIVPRLNRETLTIDKIDEETRKHLEELGHPNIRGGK